MDILILATLGLITGLLASGWHNKRVWNVIMGVLGALAIGLIINGNFSYNPYIFLIVMAGSLAVIYMARLLENFPQV